MASEKQYVELYRENKDEINKKSCSVLNDSRETAAIALEKNGFPTKKNERYKYTGAEDLFAPDFGVNLNRLRGGMTPCKLVNCELKLDDVAPFFVLNDVPLKPKSSMRDIGDDVYVRTLLEAVEEYPELLESYYNKLAKNNDGIDAFNAMLAQDGLFIYIPKGVKCAKPIQIQNLSHALVDIISVRRVLVVIEEEAEASLLVCDHSNENRYFLQTQVIEVFVGKKAKLDFTTIEQTEAENMQYNNIYFRQAEESKISYNSVSVSNGLTHNKIEFLLAGERADLVLSGAVVADREQHVDNNIEIIHEAPNCKSDVLYKYILDGEAVGAFAGKVLVKKEAQKTLSDMTNANMCVSNAAHMFSQPMLEIYADDVKCNHGTTVGQIDENALFYMRQRGISDREARVLLQYAFVNEVIERISENTLKEMLRKILEHRLQNQLENKRQNN